MGTADALGGNALHAAAAIAGRGAPALTMEQFTNFQSIASEPVLQIATVR